MKRIPKFETQANICAEVTTLANDAGIALIDAAILFAEQSNVDIELVANALAKNDNLLSKIEKEATDLNFLKKQD